MKFPCCCIRHNYTFFLIFFIFFVFFLFLVSIPASSTFSSIQFSSIFDLLSIFQLFFLCLFLGLRYYLVNVLWIFVDYSFGMTFNYDIYIMYCYKIFTTTISYYIQSHLTWYYYLYCLLVCSRWARDTEHPMF